VNLRQNAFLKTRCCIRAAASQRYCLINSSHCAKSRFKIPLIALNHVLAKQSAPVENTGPVTWPVQLQGCDGEAHNSYRSMNWTRRSVLAFCSRIFTYYWNRSIMRTRNMEAVCCYAWQYTTHSTLHTVHYKQYTTHSTLHTQTNSTDFCENWFWTVQIKCG
jgi:hypothetical protein